jgi:hypothetical protein
VRAEFYRERQGSKEVVGSATWTGSGITVEARTEDAPSVIGTIFRPTPVAVDDPSLRSFGTRGDVVLQPGSMQWFLAAARARGQAEGLEVRFLAEEKPVMGWDPAGAYRTFVSSTERLGADTTGR